MGKPVRNLVLALSASAAVIAAVCVAILSTRAPDPQEILRALEKVPQLGRLRVAYPLDGTLFPPEIPSPSFR